MNERGLNALQVAALLVSASYGIGFLFGSGEMAIAHSMGGSIYGLATAIGMLLLAVFAARLWRAGKPIWDLFGQAYGESLKNVVALLSVVWMAGVLAAQIHGGVAILRLLGAPTVLAFAIVLGVVFAASRLNLRVASTIFSCFLLVSAVVLVYALFTGGGAEIYGQSPGRLATDFGSFSTAALMSITIAVTALVCTGADYHQFVLAAKRPSTAAWGCVLAGICLVLVSPLPAAVVVGLREAGQLEGLADPKQVIPFALSRAARGLGSGLDSALLLGLSAAALGSGAAILRAMTGAIVSAAERAPRVTSTHAAVIALLIGGLLAARGQGIVATMVSVNVIYIGSTAASFAAMLAGSPLSPGRAFASVALGFAASLGIYAATWTGLVGSDDADLLSLLAGLLASSMVFVGPLLRASIRRLQA